MKLAVEFPSVAYREGGPGVMRLGRAIEEIGYDQIDMFDHVVMAHPREDRAPGPYPANMPILEAFMALGFLAAATERVGLGTEVLVLPQRDPTLVAKQVSTLDTLSGGRVRLGVGVGWQEPEYEALGFDFHDRGRRMDEAIELLRAYWRDASIERVGPHYRYQVDAVTMEPKPPQGAALPIWVGGSADRALERVGRLSDGWLAGAMEPELAREAIARIRDHAVLAGRDPDALGFQAQLQRPPRSGDSGGRGFWANHDAIASAAAGIAAAGFDWATVNMTGVFVAGARTLDALIDAMAKIHSLLRSELGA